MDNQFNTNVYHFTDEVLGLIFDKFDGKTLGSEDMTKGVVMKELFGEFKPGDKVAVQEQEPELAEPPELRRPRRRRRILPNLSDQLLHSSTTQQAFVKK